MVVADYNGTYITAENGDRMLVHNDRGEVITLSIREHDDDMPHGGGHVKLTPEEAAKLAVALLRERSLVVNGHG